MMNQQKATETHTIMPKKLAQALIEAGMKHFDTGGFFPAQAQVPNAPSQGMTLQNFSQPLQGQAQQQQATYNNQSNLAQTLINQSQGQGPNPALNQLNQTTAQNVQNQGALMASERGASSNPALMAREAANVGAQTQQTAAGQAATMTASQQLGEEQAAAGIYGNMGNQANQAMGITQGALASQNSSLVNQEVGYNNAAASASEANAQSQNQLFGGILSGAAAGAAFALLNKGGEVKPQHLDSGGFVNFAEASPPPPLTPPTQSSSGGIGSFATPLTLAAARNLSQPSQSTANNQIGEDGENYDELGVSNASSEVNAGAIEGPDMAGGAGDMALGDDALMAARGGQIPFSRALLDGGQVPGQAQVAGDNEKNDTEPTLLSPKEIVLPRSVTLAPDAPKRAEAFVAHLLQKKRSKPGYGGVLEARMCNGGMR